MYAERLTELASALGFDGWLVSFLHTLWISNGYIGGVFFFIILEMLPFLSCFCVKWLL